MKEITQEQIEAWLGTDDILAEAVEVLTDIANGEYTVENLRKDIQDYAE